VALFDMEEGGYVIGGVNEKGLTVVNAAAGSVPKNKRDTATEDLSEMLLTTFSTVADVLSHRHAFEASHPAFYIIADSDATALIEVAPGGSISKKTVSRGTLSHTNHYVDRKLLRANEQTSRSSQARLRRIGRLLAAHRPPFTLNDFIVISDDRTGGPDNSIWRTGGPGRKVKTLGTFIVSAPRGGPPELFARIVRQGEEKDVYRLTLDSAFWTRVGSPPDLQAR
jgi:hypothetical protein